ncbi:uncharacterized protein LACBIDRAFT_332038 [Laccaria bicolor S238N-H82]|uniref:Predicted protein n=1 Tax=Laccaria bicolor (strain S238N-H82 / ATCC MYA-4686) TaxID=486041 RepID=B0DRD2_LACBS|nr:uncharacterized protein LACBIDRAFT_332038 [Laccaria bicolor S238N-H82]EDR02850.1 predicted protein [Laccaria bicolor S238N-H82]|eukprot:XP_001886560.1 predicted protein [Laccaria bicolor S238N-H82]
MADAPISSSPLQHEPSLSHAECAAQELAGFMSQSPGTSDAGDDFGGRDDAPSPGDVEEEFPSGVLETTPSRGSDTNGIVVACRLLRQQQLTPYQRTEADQFIKVYSFSCCMMIFLQLCSVKNKLDEIVKTAPPFTVSGPLFENMKSLVVAVLLSAKLGAYKGSLPRDHVFTLIKKDGVHLPAGFEKNAYTLKVINSAIQDELTQAHSRIKKMIKESVVASETIFELTTAVITNTHSSVTVPLCARLALLCKLYTEVSDATYWDKVDARLKLIRTMAGDDTMKITRTFEKILEGDQAKYGD